MKKEETSPQDLLSWIIMFRNIIIFLFIIFLSAQSFADQNDIRLNRLFDKLIVTELIQNKFNKHNLEHHLLSIITKNYAYKNQIYYFNKIEEVLKNKKALPSVHASKLIERILCNNSL